MRSAGPLLVVGSLLIAGALRAARCGYGEGSHPKNVALVRQLLSE